MTAAKQKAKDDSAKKSAGQNSGMQRQDGRWIDVDAKKGADAK